MIAAAHHRGGGGIALIAGFAAAHPCASNK